MERLSLKRKDMIGGVAPRRRALKKGAEATRGRNRRLNTQKGAPSMNEKTGRIGEPEENRDSHAG